MVDMNLPQLAAQFQSEQKCREYLESLRWPEGVMCLRCGSHKISRVLKRGQFDCDSCRYQFSVTVGTIFHDTHLPLWKWLLATYLIAESKKGVSANQLKRTLAVSYKTAWYLSHRIRAAMKDASGLPLGGVVEVDETWIGGKRRGVGRGNYRDYKTAVIGAVQRGGHVRLKVINRVSQRAAKRFINEATQPSAGTIYTDEAPLYEGAIPKGVKHDAVNHGNDEWRSIVGSYHQVSTKHLPRYLDEIAFKHNNRRSRFLFRDTVLRLLKAEALQFKQLTAD